MKQSVGKSACLVGEALDITYFSSDNYLEVNTLTLFLFSHCYDRKGQRMC